MLRSFQDQSAKLNFDDYIIGHKIRNSKFGCVYSALDSKTNTKCVFKIIVSDLNKKCICNLLTTLEIIRISDFPMVVKNYGYLFFPKTHKYYGNKLVIVNELFNGEDLSSFSQKEELMTKLIIYKIIYGIAYAMKQFQSIHLLHLDLNPKNVFLDENYEPHLDMSYTPFYLKSDNQHLHINFTTKNYAAPEITYDSEVNINSDVFSFGLVIFSMFCDLDLYEKLSLIENCKKPSIIDDFFWQIILFCCDSDPNKRSSFDEIVEYLGLDDTLKDFFTDENEIDQFKAYKSKIELNSINTSKISNLI